MMLNIKKKKKKTVPVLVVDADKVKDVLIIKVKNF